MSATLEYPRRHPISAEEYFRMGAAGVFAPDARLELIDGEIIEMAPIEPPHASRVKRLNNLLADRTRGRAILSVQDPLIISGRSVPQPDVALLKPRADFYESSHPTSADVFLVIEVADTSLPYDLRRKAPLYARCGVPELWVVDVNDRLVHVFRDPRDEGFATSFQVRPGESVACAARPEARIQADELFPA